MLQELYCNVRGDINATCEMTEDEYDNTGMYDVLLKQEHAVREYVEG